VENIFLSLQKCCSETLSSKGDGCAGGSCGGCDCEGLTTIADADGNCCCVFADTAGGTVGDMVANIVYKIHI
jgi:hypothetical protein